MTFARNFARGSLLFTFRFNRRLLQARGFFHRLAQQAVAVGLDALPRHHFCPVAVTWMTGIPTEQTLIYCAWELSVLALVSFIDKDDEDS
jgi:hypothetical protein